MKSYQIEVVDNGILVSVTEIGLNQGYGLAGSACWPKRLVFKALEDFTGWVKSEGIFKCPPLES